MRPLTERYAQDPDDNSERQIGRRAHGRLRVYLPAQMTSIYGCQHVQLQNLSQGGLKLRWNAPVRTGSAVVIAWTDYELFGNVIWADDRCGGVSLELPLPEALVVAMRARESGPVLEQNEVTTAWYLENLRYHQGRR